MTEQPNLLQARIKTLIKPAILLAGCLLLCLFMYYGAAAIADRGFERAISEAERATVQNREGAFHYNRLTAKEQLLYDAIQKAVEKQKEETEILTFVPTEDEYRNALRALILDCPALFYLETDFCSLNASEHTAAVKLSYCEAPTGKSAQLQGAVDRILAVVKAKSQSERETALYLHDELIKNCTYPAEKNPDEEYDVTENTAYDALVRGTANGFGYALAYQLLCEKAGLACFTITGYANDVRHAWNCVAARDENGILQTGYTDVMWDDVPQSKDVDPTDALLPFHGYEFLSFDEMALDHTPDSADAIEHTDTDNYYERMNLSVDGEDALLPFLEEQLVSSVERGSDIIEFSVSENVSDYSLEQALHAAISAVNASAKGSLRLRSVNRIYRASAVRCAVTVQLFYEDLS